MWREWFAAAGAGEDNGGFVGNLIFNMNLNRLALQSTLALALGLSFTGVAMAQTAAPAKAAPKATAAKPVPAPAPAPNVAPPPASKEQIEAAEHVDYGVDDCEFNQKVDVSINPKYPGYVDVTHGSTKFLMKPVESHTGAIRLEDVRGEGLMVQIANKSMLLNTKTGKRIVDDCVSEKQRGFRAADKAAKDANGGKDTGSSMFSSKPAGK